MTFKNTATRIALAAMLAASPAALTAQPQSGSPAQSVAEDPDENVGGEVNSVGSMEQTSRSIETPGAYDDARTDEEIKGSLIQTDPEDTEGSQLLTE
ncbi:hypothetical protein FIU94_16050 [Sulfitobacter sp. THAF37]|uniref:hypothetical protein n=1 Tax=Sulfitobacter sp. THAF37 TaxID=2587855 RepID=UPI00126879C9|nr:hypothetical protein [Sulfitobacter sp. THAF37]QFT60342.1 hypothetical protein FIU94_16050 [Sulfitobacter sp. THAF37]